MQRVQDWSFDHSGSVAPLMYHFEPWRQHHPYPSAPEHDRAGAVSRDPFICLRGSASPSRQVRSVLSLAKCLAASRRQRRESETVKRSGVVDPALRHVLVRASPGISGGPHHRRMSARGRACFERRSKIAPDPQPAAGGRRVPVRRARKLALVAVDYPRVPVPSTGVRPRSDVLRIGTALVSTRRDSNVRRLPWVPRTYSDRDSDGRRPEAGAEVRVHVVVDGRSPRRLGQTPVDGELVDPLVPGARAGKRAAARGSLAAERRDAVQSAARGARFRSKKGDAADASLFLRR